MVTYSNRPIALAGVMGGADEAVNEATTSIWLEAAVFAPQAVRRSARSVGLRTEASSRFEKGLPRRPASLLQIGPWPCLSNIALPMFRAAGYINEPSSQSSRCS